MRIQEHGDHLCHSVSLLCFENFFGLFLNIKSIQFLGFGLKHVLDLIRFSKLSFSKNFSIFDLLVAC